MKLELKKIKVCKWASEETHCYQATLYRDGVPIIEVSNEGYGGSDSQWAIKPFENNIIDEVEDWCKILNGKVIIMKCMTQTLKFGVMNK
jgi:hypothetical protein